MWPPKYKGFWLEGLFFLFFGRQILQVLFNKLGNSNAAAHVFSAGHCKKVIIIITIKIKSCDVASNCNVVNANQLIMTTPCMSLIIIAAIS